MLSLAEAYPPECGTQDPILPKRATATSRQLKETPTLAKCVPAERVYVPFEEEGAPEVGGTENQRVASREESSLSLIHI